MKTIRIIALHLAYGGIEKAIISTANMLAERYPVEILSVYHMPDSPAFPLDPRVKVRYLLRECPNREEWKQALYDRDLAALARESMKSLRILIGKKLAVRKTIREIHDGVLITTRHEDNLVLSSCGDPKVLKIAQLHQDHNFDAGLIRGFRKGYSNIDIFALLAPRLAEEMKEIMRENQHTKLISIPNCLPALPERVELSEKERLVLAVGRLDAVKGFDRLIEAFVLLHERAPEWTLEIVGEGEERKRLEEQIASNHAEEYITLTGKLDAAGVEQQMRRASIYAMSSHSECLPYVLLEAQSCYLPCVAFDVRVGPGVLIEEGKTGLLVPDGDIAAYVNALFTLMNDPAERFRMGQQGRANAACYTREKVAEMWFRILEGTDGR